VSGKSTYATSNESTMARTDGELLVDPAASRRPREPDARAGTDHRTPCEGAHAAGQAYHRGRVIARAPAMFEVPSRGYAKSATQVFHEGALIPHAPGRASRRLEITADGPSAGDRGATYREAKRTPRP
jgi:hypothetical protein